MCVYCLFNYLPPPSGTITQSSGPLKLSHSSCTLSCSLFKLFFPFHFDRLLSYKEHSIKFPYIKCTVQWFLVYSEVNHTVWSFVTGSLSMRCCHVHPCCSMDVWGFLPILRLSYLSFCFCLLCVFGLYWIIRVPYTYILDTSQSPGHMICKYLLPFCVLSLTFLIGLIGAQMCLILM